MSHFVRLIYILFICGTLFLVSGCGAQKTSPSGGVPSQDYTITCIGVLPAVSMSDPRTVDKEKEKSLRRGVEVMNRILSRELGGQTHIRFVTSGLAAGLNLTGSENTFEIARLVGKSINCNAILETNVWIYTERIGGKYTADKPAAVAFDMRLIGVDTKTVLWTAKFNEVQRSVMENLYDWGKASSRGFTWVSAEDLMEEGIREKIADGPYFKEPQKKSNLDQQYSPANRV